MKAVAQYLHQCRELAALCTQNGWIDNDTLHYEILEADAESVLAIVEFEEQLMEGAGCPAGRVSCYGRVRLLLDKEGRVTRAEIC
jgi:hypothetical protein